MARLTSPIANRLIFSFLLVIVIFSVAFAIAGVFLIRNRVVAEAQEMVRQDLNAAREIYSGSLRGINDVIRLTADRFFLREGLQSADLEAASVELNRVMASEDLDVLTITDRTGRVVLRTSDPQQVGDDQRDNTLVNAVLTTGQPVAGTLIMSGEDLERESPSLAERAFIRFIDTPLARARPETEESSGMMLVAAAPVLDEDGTLLGVAYGGVLLNGDFTIVDEVKQTVFQGLTYRGHDTGTATIFQDDVRISTNVLNADGSRAVGTRVSEEVYRKVMLEGEPWVGRAYVVNNWYITAYEPIRDIEGRIVGILYVGLLEAKYVDLQRQTVLIFLAISLTGALVASALSYIISRRISVPITRMALAAQEVAQGNLDAKVEVASGDELGQLADSFNAMALALKQRDQRLRDFTTKQVMESERLALIGQLSANVAHELNNPLQGILAYSHLLQERIPDADPSSQMIARIVTQTGRCREIIRGLLDFARQKKPDKTISDVNHVLRDIVSLIVNQALFHNIEIVQDLDPDLPTAIMDPSQIERLFMNLIINAAEAMDGRGRLRLATRFDPESRSVEIRFEDTGHGIPEEYMDKIFDPFFTTKEIGHGTGLGLAIRYGIQGIPAVKAYRDGQVVAEFLEASDRYRIVFDRFAAKVPFQDGGIATRIYEHGDSNNGDALYPKTWLYLEGWGTATMTINVKQWHTLRIIHRGCNINIFLRRRAGLRSL